MMDRIEPFWYKSLTFSELPTHLRNLLDEEKTVDRMEIELVKERTYVSLLRKEFSKKPTELLMVIRVSDVGREALTRLDGIFVEKS